jgi:negative regulator of flagellin synthesis FlgM
MSRIESGFEPGPARAISRIEARIARKSADGGDDRFPSAKASPVATVARSDALDPGKPPVDAERVATIRKAIESGDYPVIPTTVADAVIAAGMLWRSPE